jgi:hypothetical protein
MSILQCVVRRFQLSESVLLVTVIGKVFRTLVEFLGGTIRLVLRKLQLLFERMQLELYTYLISNTLGYDKR